jgi:hypothetical protein
LKTGARTQVAHQLEANRFVTDLIAATLADPCLGVSEWWPPAEAADHERMATSAFGRGLEARS